MKVVQNTVCFSLRRGFKMHPGVRLGAVMMSLVGRHPVLIPLLEEEQEEEEKAKASGRSAVKQGKENMP